MLIFGAEAHSVDIALLLWSRSGACGTTAGVRQLMGTYSGVAM